MFNRSSESTSLECISHGACSVSPNSASLHEAMFIMLSQIAFYILKLEKHDIKSDKISEEIVEYIASINEMGDFPPEEILLIFSKLYVNLESLKQTFSEKCAKCETPKEEIIITPDTTMADIISQGEKALKDVLKTKAPKQRHIIEILISVIKGVCANIVVYRDLEKIHESASHEIVKVLDLLNQPKVTVDKIRTEVTKLTDLNKDLMDIIYKTQIELYGEVRETKVSLSTRPGKAIMVSGLSLYDLHQVLEATEDKDIDVYSNKDLIIAHAYPEFAKFEHFRGHFCSNGGWQIAESRVLDLATFPGAILLTRNEVQNVEYLYRGRLYTTDDIAPKGVIKIDDNDFTPLIEAATEARGFRLGRERETVKIGYNTQKLEEKLDEITENFDNYKHLVVIGFSTKIHHEYYEKLIELMPEDVFVISFSYPVKHKNSLVLNVGHSFALLYHVMRHLYDRIPINSDKITVFASRCEIRSLLNIVRLKEEGAKNVYMSGCSPRLVNPATLETFKEIFNVKSTTNPKDDLKDILEKASK